MKQFPPLIYVAGAYNAPTLSGIRANIAKAERTSISLIRNGWHVLTPHKNTSGYEQYEDGVLTKETWINMDLNTLARCDAIYVMDNWETSVGTQCEMRFALKHDIPTFFEDMHPAKDFCPGDLPAYCTIYGV